MSLNKFFDEQTGLDLKLHIGADTIKANTLEVLGDLTLEGKTVPVTTYTTDVVPVPTFPLGGSGVLVHNTSVYKTEIIGAVRYSTLSGALQYSNIVGCVQGANKTVELSFPLPDGIEYPANNANMCGAVSCQINDAVVTGLYTTSLDCIRSAQNIVFDINSVEDFALADPNRVLDVSYSVSYTSVVA